MFKLESYITPILLSYVDRYIKNFRPEDSQVSLWGGDASFQNLDLRLEVLEQELQLPFSFVSGHIHELLIHVPWTKLASEPINITINTIECILKLRTEDSVASDTNSTTTTNTSRESRKKSKGKHDIVAPPGYVQSLVNKIVSNITIQCHNLILKYVEEDIVLSVNAKTVTLQSANENWEPAFTELSPTQVMLRKLITLFDLTICLDKRNASGKIEMYQEPLLYRCLLEMHLLRSYHSAKAKRASVTRMDLHSTRMDFSVTDQQFPMLMRLALLAMALHSKELRPETAPPEQELETLPESEIDLEDDELQEEGSWTSWAWNWVPSLLPLQGDEDWSSEQQLAYSGHTLHFGFYVQQASITLKVTEVSGERSYFGPRKVKFMPFLLVQLNGCFVDTVMHGMGWLNAQLGISRVLLQSCGSCLCGVKEGPNEVKQDELYFSSGSIQKNYLSDSLFDPGSVENKGQKKSYSISWDYHLATVTETLLLEKTPALAIDYLYMVEIPEDISSDRLSELGSDLEYSNLFERALCRVVVGPTVVHLCSGLFHRLQMLQYVANMYDYCPYSTPKPELTREQLPPASAEDFEALDANIPLQVFQVTLFEPMVQIHLADHPYFDPALFQGRRKKRKVSQVLPLHGMENIPKITLNCQCMDAKLVRPMYPRRLVTTTCQLPSPPSHMFSACHLQLNIKLLGAGSQLILGPNKQTTVIMPSNISFSQENLLLPQYWDSVNLPHTDRTWRAESVTITCTKAKLLVISLIAQSLINPACSTETVSNTTLLSDAAKDSGVEYLELCIESLTFRQVLTPSTVATAITLGAIKAFVLEQLLDVTQQALVLSGPDAPSDLSGVGIEDPLLTCTIQCPYMPTTQAHPPVLIFNLRMVRVCVDPLLWRWLRYSPLPVPIRSYDAMSVDTHTNQQSWRTHKLSESSGPHPDTFRRSSTPQESVHSSSDRDQAPVQLGTTLPSLPSGREIPPKSVKEETVPSETEQRSWCSREGLLHWFPVWRGLVLCGDMAQCVIYLPTVSLSAVGAQSIEEALEQSLQASPTENSPDVLVLKFPYVTLRSAAQCQGLHQYTKLLPFKLPENIWTKSKVSFPWSLSLSDLGIYTIQKGRKLYFLKPVSANATVGISSKYQADEVSLASIGLCVHVDTTPVCLSVSEAQIFLMASVLLGLFEVASTFQIQTVHKMDYSASADALSATPTSPTLFRESTGSRDSATPHDMEDSSEKSQMSSPPEEVRLTAWLQSTLARLVISLYTEDINVEKPTSELKLVLDMEDIITSVDLQQVYLKMKCKIASASIQHFIRLKKRHIWRPGAYLGLVMRGHEDQATPSLHTSHRDLDDAGGSFLSITFTSAKSCNVHSRWGTHKQSSLLAHTRHSDSSIKMNTDSPGMYSKFISEIVVKLQAVDFVLSPATLISFVKVLQPLVMLSNRDPTDESKKCSQTLNVNSATLPLLHMDTRAVRLIMPASDLTDVGNLHDVFIFQLDQITLSPQVENPLGRVMVRQDIYQMAEHAQILGVPGSEVEDRQYQLYVTGLCMNTGTWRELDQCLSSQGMNSSLRTMNENPALEWNNLVTGKESITPHMSLLPVISRMNLCIVAAPAIVYRNDILVCGHSLEVNAVTDIQVSISTKQLILASALCAEIMTLSEVFLEDVPTYPITLPPGLLPRPPLSEEVFLPLESITGPDSGVDCADASSASTRNLSEMPSNSNQNKMSRENLSTTKSSSYREIPSSSPSLDKWQCHQSKSVTYKDISCRDSGMRTVVFQIQELKGKDLQNPMPFEILLTSGTVSIVLYEIVEMESQSQSHNLNNKGKSQSNENNEKETNDEDTPLDDVPPVKQLVQPLIYVLLAQPHAFMSQQSFLRKIQVSCFDFSVRASILGHTVARPIPIGEDFPSILVETKCGEPHPETGIPPSFLTVKWACSAGKSGKLEIDIGRPTKFYISIARWQYLKSVQDKVLECLEDITLLSTKNSDLQTSDLVKDMDSTDKLPPLGLETGATSLHTRDYKEKDTVGVTVKEDESVLLDIPNDVEDDNDNCCTEDNEEIGETFYSSSQTSRLGEHNLQKLLGGIAGVTVKSQQLVLAIESASGAEISLSAASLSGSTASISRTQVDRIISNVTINSLIITTTVDQVTRLLLNPWSCTADLCLVWEAWHADSPQIQLTADSDCIILDVGPEHLRSLHDVLIDYTPLLYISKKASGRIYEWTSPRGGSEQHYRDDLRAGAFQFVEASGSSCEDMPLPYQVVFCGSPPTMAWRYPQPRVLTRVDVFPVPFKVATMKHQNNADEVQDHVLCSLQYWSECQARYQSFAQFHLSESEPCHLELPAAPRQAVACIWRVRLSLQSEEEGKDSRSHVSVCAQALAACMRVDSFFSPEFVPSLQAAINITSLQVSLYNHLTPAMAAMPMPPPMEMYTIDSLIPETQCFMSASLDSCSLFVCAWPSGDNVMEVSSRVRCDVIDYAYLTQHCIIEPFQIQLNFLFGSTLDISCVTKPISVRFGPSIGHTLAVSAQLWALAWQNFIEDPNEKSSAKYQVIVSRYVICNDTTCSIRFGQTTTDEDILLLSRQCHLYSWRTQKGKQQLRVAVEDGGWRWSDPISVDSDGIQLCSLDSSRKYKSGIVINVMSLSATQKSIIISGQLVVTNLLAEPFECKIVTHADEEHKIRIGHNLIAPGQSTPPSILLNSGHKTALRIRFHGLDSVWSGDIPLQESPKSGQPWLVKIPLQDKGQFLSIWCRVIHQTISHGKKMLAMLCPLYMIRSHLPIPAKISIDTPGLQVNMQATIKGRGEQQQLYCPGTIDHSHKLMLQLETDIPPSNPYVPLSYTMIDQRTFFKLKSSEDLNIDTVLKSLTEKQNQGWPFVGEEYDGIEWIESEQPETFVQVKYKPLGTYCSTLLVDLQPWALLVNTLGCPISLAVKDKTLCCVPHKGVVMPPKLEETFHLIIDIEGIQYVSPSLQLARNDLGSSFYMPRITGLIPVSGEITTTLQGYKVVNLANISSELMEDMRIVHVRPKYILCNHTCLQLDVSAIAICDSINQRFPTNELESCIYSIPPLPCDHKNAGCPLIQWSLIGDADKDLVYYLSFNKMFGWSCPIRVSNGFPRHGFMIPSSMSDSNSSNDTFVLTMQEHGGQIYLSVHPELYPTVTLYNKCNFELLCAQGTPENDGSAEPESPHIEWWCSIKPHTRAHYCPPGCSKYFPDLVSRRSLPPLVLALGNSLTSGEKCAWSLNMSISDVQEQFVCLPGHGDVKVHVELQCHTTYVTIETVSHVEISARDIRSRLLERDSEACSRTHTYTHEDQSTHYNVKHNSSSTSLKDKVDESNSSLKSLDKSMCESAIESLSNTSGSNYSSAVDLPSVYTSKSSSKRSNLSLCSVNSRPVVKLSDLEECFEDGSVSKPLHFHVVCFIKGLHITLLEDLPKAGSERTEVILLTLDNVCASAHPNAQTAGAEDIDIHFLIGDLQIDNQMYQRGGFDFPVVVLSQWSHHPSSALFSLNVPAKKLMEQVENTALLKVATKFERYYGSLVAKHVKMSIGPLSAYVEDTLITKLIEDVMCFVPTAMVFLPKIATDLKQLNAMAAPYLVPVPQPIYWDSRQLAFPIRLRTLTIDPLSVLLSVHTSVTLYIALDHSPLQFASFERHQLLTTPYRLGHTVTMHYLSCAIFGMGWVVGSLELLGSPGGFARMIGSGLRDFVNLPYQGIFQGPWAFLVGVSHGSASLMKHITAGTLSSVTKMAASVARNLDRLTLDKEHLQRTEELRRQRPQGLTQGLVQGLTGLGISLLGALGGIAHHPLQSVMNDGASTRSLFTGLGLGLVGVITKPLSGAAELVALTGEGLLHGTGWTCLPRSRQQPVIEHSFYASNSNLKYNWKLIAGLSAGKHTLLYVTEATYVSNSGRYEAVALVLTTRALFLVNTEEDVTQRVLALSELSGLDHPSDPTLLCFQFNTPGPLLEMDATSHARVVDFVRRSGGLLGIPPNEETQDNDSSPSVSPVDATSPSVDTPLTFYVNPQSRNYFLSVLALAKQQSQGKGFSIL